MCFKAKSIQLGLIVCIFVSQASASPRQLYKSTVQKLLKTSSASKQKYEEIVIDLKKVQKQARRADTALYQLASMALGRVYYEAALSFNKNDKARNVWLKKSVKAYDNIPRFSDKWPDALFEKAWAMLLLNKAGGSLGQLYSLNHSYFKNYTNLERFYLTSLIYLENCHYETAEESLRRLNEALKSARGQVVALKKWLKSGPVSFEEFYGKNVALREYILSDSVFRSQERSFQYLKQEEERRRKKGVILSILNKEKAELQNQFKKRLERFVVQKNEEFSLLERKAAYLEVEIATQKLSKIVIAPKKQSGLVRRDIFSRDTEKIVWAANRETWVDELGFHYVFLESRCRD